MHEYMMSLPAWIRTCAAAYMGVWAYMHRCVHMYVRRRLHPYSFQSKRMPSARPSLRACTQMVDEYVVQAEQARRLRRQAVVRAG